MTSTVRSRSVPVAVSRCTGGIRAACAGANPARVASAGMSLARRVKEPATLSKSALRSGAARAAGANRTPFAVKRLPPRTMSNASISILPRGAVRPQINVAEVLPGDFDPPSGQGDAALRAREGARTGDLAADRPAQGGDRQESGEFPEFGDLDGAGAAAEGGLTPPLLFAREGHDDRLETLPCRGRPRGRPARAGWSPSPGMPSELKPVMRALRRRPSPTLDAPEGQEGRKVPERAGEGLPRPRRGGRASGFRRADPAGRRDLVQPDLVRADAPLRGFDSAPLPAPRIPGSTRRSTARPASWAPCQSRESVPVSAASPPPPSRHLTPLVESCPRSAPRAGLTRMQLRLQVDPARIPAHRGSVRACRIASRSRPTPAQSLRASCRSRSPGRSPSSSAGEIHERLTVDLRRW